MTARLTTPTPRSWPPTGEPVFSAPRQPCPSRRLLVLLMWLVRISHSPDEGMFEQGTHDNEIHHELIRPVLVILLVLLMLMSSTSFTENLKPQQVWLLAGQSNMIGYGTSTAALPPKLRQPRSNIKVFTDADTGWVELAPGLGPNNGMFGPGSSLLAAIWRPLRRRLISC